jgi:hypothetical protein
VWPRCDHLPSGRSAARRARSRPRRGWLRPARLPVRGPRSGRAQLRPSPQLRPVQPLVRAIVAFTVSGGRGPAAGQCGVVPSLGGNDVFRDEGGRYG